MVTEGSIRNLIVQYDPEILLQLCADVSSNLDKQRETVFIRPWPKTIGKYIFQQDIIITQYKLALFARIVLQNYPWAHSDKPNLAEFLRLVNNVGSIDDPFTTGGIKGKEDLVGILVRLTYQQWPTQEGVSYSYPRHLLIYLSEHTKPSPIDLDKTFNNRYGLTIKEFIILGFLFYALALANPFFSIELILKTEIKSLIPYITPNKVNAFLSLCSSNFDNFRKLCLKEENDFPKAGIYRFNPMNDYPIIKRKDGLLCAPVPRFLLNRVTKGLYYDFIDDYSTSAGNSFTEWFGYAFEDYGGMLFRDTFGAANTFKEPRFGSPEKRGPDWVVIQGNSALACEFRSGRLNKKAKAYADYEEIIKLTKRNIVDTLEKLPSKISDIKASKTGLPIDNIVNYVPCIVTYEPLYPHGMFLDLIRQQLTEDHVPLFDFELMSIEVLEYLLAWTKHQNIFEFFQMKWSKPEWKEKSVRGFIEEQAKEKGIRELKNPLLEKTANKFWGDIDSKLFNNTKLYNV